MSNDIFIFGEVLFDSYPDNKVLGGAPFNVAWHLKGFGQHPLFISRIGDDHGGAGVMTMMQRWGLDTSALQVDRDHPTGIVAVQMQGSVPSYNIVPDQAYDHVAADDEIIGQLAGDESGLFYYGSLALRSDDSREAWRAYIKSFPGTCFVDINLRRPWHIPEVWPEIMDNCDVLKLNWEELEAIGGHKLADQHECRDKAQELLQLHELTAIVVTMGHQGAVAVDSQGKHYYTPAAGVEPLRDTVGAGDAFSAILILGQKKQWPLADTLVRAAEFAAEACKHRGALIMDKGVYSNFQNSWEEE